MTTEPSPSHIYVPAIKKARWLKGFQLGTYRAVLGTDCESAGQVFYMHVLYVFAPGAKRAVLAVSSEYTDMTGTDGSRCLGLFADGAHYNLGFSFDWADLSKFERRALEVAASHLHITEPPQELPAVPADLL